MLYPFIWKRTTIWIQFQRVCKGCANGFKICTPLLFRCTPLNKGSLHLSHSPNKNSSGVGFSPPQGIDFQMLLTFGSGLAIPTSIANRISLFTFSTETPSRAAIVPNTWLACSVVIFLFVIFSTSFCNGILPLSSTVVYHRTFVE